MKELSAEDRELAEMVPGLLEHEWITEDEVRESYEDPDLCRKAVGAFRAFRQYLTDIPIVTAATTQVLLYDGLAEVQVRRIVATVVVDAQIVRAIPGWVVTY